MTGGNPFPGLRAFGVEESHLFFGRERPTDELLGKLRTNRFIAVVGTSGSGKSSLVRAGMLPDLHGGLMTSAGSSWRVALLRPGNAPIRAMAEALSQPDVFGSADADAGLKTAITETVLRRGAGGLVTATQQARMAPDENLLVVVDQFEELFRFKNAGSDVRAADEAAAFVKLLLEASTQDSVPVYVVLTMRSEFLGDCTQFRDLPEAINAGQYLIPRMTRDQQKEAITGPVAVGGAHLTPRLLQRLLNDVGDNPDQLPILQHAMMRTWDNWVQRNRPDEPIDIPHYEAIGAMTEALSRHADEAFNELPDGTHRWLAERIFKRLTEKGTDNRELRLPAQVDELCSITGATTQQVISVIDVFRREGRWFLMPPPAVALDETTLIDISHESLIRIWTRLRRWVNEEAESSRIYRRLAETSALYPREAGLWRDPDLQIALQWRESNDPNQAWAQRYSAGFDNAMEFLDESKAAARRRWLLVMAPVVLIPLLLIGLGTGFAVYGWLEAEQLAREQMERAEEERERNDEALAELNAIKVEEEENQQRQQVQEEVIETARRIVASEGPGQDDDSQLNAELLQAVNELEELEKRESETATAIESDGIGRLAVVDRNAATAALGGLGGLGATDPEVEANVALGASADSENPVPSREPAAAVDGAVLASSPGLEPPDDSTVSVPMPERAASAATIRVGEFVTSRDVVRLEPENIGDEFPPGKVTAFARVYSPQAESLTIRWYADGEEELRSREVTVQSNMASGYRIYDWKTLTEPGSYEVRLFDAGQQELGALNFEINPEIRD